MKNDPKLVECLFGHHVFFTRGCVRQCTRCKIVQLYAGSEGWIPVELGASEDWDLETMRKPKKLIKTDNEWHGRYRKNTL